MAECPVCFEQFTADHCIPRVLPCSHTVCEACVDALPAMPCLGGIPTRQCPLDRKKITLPATGVSGLPCNYTLVQARPPTMEDKAHDCEECDTPKEEATTWCIGCSTYLCTEHSESLHQHSLRQHLRVPLGQKPPMCSKHPQYQLDSFCVTHAVLLCERCINPLYCGEHAPIPGVHDVMLAGEAVKSAEEELMCLRVKMATKRENLLKGNDRLQRLKQRLQEVEDGALELIKDEFDRAYAVFLQAGEERQQHLRRRVAEECSKCIEEFKEHQRLECVIEHAVDAVLQTVDTGLAAGGVSLLEMAAQMPSIAESLEAHQPVEPIALKIPVAFRDIDVTTRISNHGHFTPLRLRPEPVE